VRPRAALDPAARPGQDHGRRDPRQRDGADRDQLGAHRPPRVHDRPRQQRPRRPRTLSEHGCRGLSVRVGAQLRAGAAAGAQHLPSLQAPGQGHPRAARRVRARSGARVQPHLLRGDRLHRVRRHRLQGADGDLRAARPHRSHPRDDSREAADLGDQEGGARRRHALPPRVGGRAGDERRHHAARDQQGDVRRMSFLSTLRDSPAPAAAVEIAADRVSAASLEWRSGQPVVATHATEPLAAGALVPALTAANIHDRPRVLEPLTRVLERVGRPRRVGLVVPDVVAKVSLVKFETVPTKAQELDQLIRWQVRKTAPFAIEEAQVSYVPGLRADDGQEYVVSLARRSVVQEYEALCAEAGTHAGIVDLCTFNVVNAVLAGSNAPSAAATDWLLVNMAVDYTSIALLRGKNLIFFRNRAADTE